MKEIIEYTKEVKESVFSNNIFNITMPRIEHEFEAVEDQPTLYFKPFSAIKSETIRQFAEKAENKDFEESESIKNKVILEMLTNLVNSKNIMLSDIDNTVVYKSENDRCFSHNKDLVLDFITRDEINMNMFLQGILNNMYTRLKNISNQKKT